jgi:hypothetical protein
MRKIIFSLILLIIVAGCRKHDNSKTGQGFITYRVTYPGNEKFSAKSMLFPKEIVLVFKDKRAAFVTTGGLGMVELVNLLDHKDKKFVSLLLDHSRKNIGCALTPDEIKQNENAAQYKIEETNETKTIAGVQSRKAIVHDLTNNKSFEIYYDDKIKFWYWNSPYKDFNYLFTQYTHTINGLTMQLEATNIDLTTPVDTNIFSVKGNYEWVNQKTFFDYLSTL